MIKSYYVINIVNGLKALAVGFAVVLLEASLVAGGSADWTSGPNDQSALAINLAGVTDWSTEMPFVDLFRRARAWISQQEGKPWGQGPNLPLTPDGWPARLADGQYATTLISGGGHPSGLYTCLYDGRGDLRLWGDVRDVRREGSGRITFTSTGADSIFVDIRATEPEDPVRAIRVLMPGCEASYKTDPFHPHFLERTGRFRAIRFMDWMETNNSRIAAWDQRPKLSDFSQAVRGVSLEIMIDLSNRLQADPWFCMPHLADDTYIRRFAEMVRDRLDPHLKVYVEHSNEVWNGQFEQARHAAEQGARLGLSKDRYQGQLYYHAKRSVEIFRIWEDVFGGTDRLVRVLASQSANPWVSEQVLSFEDAFQHADALAIAPYFGNELGDPRTADEVARMSVDDILARCREAIARGNQIIIEQAALARARGLDLIAYEAGQHLVGHGGAENDERLTELFHAANRDPRMADLYREYLNGWRSSGGRLCAIFSSVGAFSKWGSWGILETEYQEPAGAPKYRAVMAFLEENPVWWDE